MPLPTSKRVFRVHATTPMCLPSSYVNPEYFQLYVDTICEKETRDTCLSRIYVPLPEKQLEIVDKMNEIRSHMYIGDADSAILKLLIKEDDFTLNVLLGLIDQYNQSLEMIRILVQQISAL